LEGLKKSVNTWVSSVIFHTEMWVLKFTGTKMERYSLDRHVLSVCIPSRLQREREVGPLTELMHLKGTNPRCRCWLWAILRPSLGNSTVAKTQQWRHWSVCLSGYPSVHPPNPLAIP
jgi:hypothetical protein